LTGGKDETNFMQLVKQGKIGFKDFQRIIVPTLN